MHRVALESIREIVIDRNSKIFVRLGRKTESFFSSNQDFVAGEIYQKRSFIDGIYLRKKRFNLITDENVSTTWNVFYTYVEWKNVILRVVRVIKILVLDGLSGFTQWNLFPEKKKKMSTVPRKEKKKNCVLRGLTDRSCYQEQFFFSRKPFYEVTNAWNIDSVDSNVSFFKIHE